MSIEQRIAELEQIFLTINKKLEGLEGFSYRYEKERLQDRMLDCDELFYIIKELQAENKKLNWQDISTAPKDGSEFLVCYVRQGGVTKLIYWDKIHKQWLSKGELVLFLHAEYWMPIPSTPKI